MATKTKFSLLLLLTFSLFLASQCYHTQELIGLQKCQMGCLEDEEEGHGTHHLTLCLMGCQQGYAREVENDEDPQLLDPRKQYEWCQRECQKSEEEEEQKELKQYCQDQCRERFEEQKQQQEERAGEIDNYLDQAPETKFRQCQLKCKFRKEGEERERCKKGCLEEYSKKRGREGGEYGGKSMNEENPKGSRGEEEQGEYNPYFFEGQRFRSRIRTEAGEFKVLERFSKKSELLKGIDNYRLAILEADPNTFLLPHHCDSEVVVFVNRGEGTITFVHQERRESFNLEGGDAIRVPAGSTIYLINRHNNDKLQIFMLIQPINTPGHFEGFFGAGGQEPQSFYRVFSNELLEAAFNTPRDKLERLFGQQRKGFIVRGRPEQIRALSQHAEGSSRWRRQSRGPFNLLSQRPSFCNNYGKFFRASPEDYDQLKDLDVSVAVMNINQGAMVAPYYNSKSTILVLVAQGNGYFEMACPHLARQSQQGPRGTGEREQEQRRKREQEQRGIHYQKVSGRLSDGDVFIIPAGHPISIVSTGDQNLQLVGFGLNAQNNHKYFLAGQDNIWNQVESEAKELSFNVPSREVDQVFKSQEQSYFMPGPGQQQQQQQRGREGGGIPVSSILDVVGIL